MVADPTVTLNIDSPSTAGAAGYLVIGNVTYGKIGTGKVGGPVTYFDYGNKVRSLSSQRGASSAGLLFGADAGQFTAKLNNRSRTFDPTVNTDVVPGRAMQATVTYNAVTYNLFTGTVDDWPAQYPGQGVDAIVDIQCSDGFPQLAQLNVNETGIPSALTGVRVRRLANMVGWPAALRNISDGTTTMPGSGSTISALAAMGEARDSEFGQLYVETNGHLTFRDRTDIGADTRSRTSQATFGDGGGAELKFADVTVVPFNRASIYNDITVVYNQQGDSVEASDASSINTYGLLSTTVQVKIADDADGSPLASTVAANFARWLVTIYGTPRVRVGSFVVKPMRDPTNLWPQVLGRKYGDRITVKFQPLGGGARISHDAFIIGIHHDAPTIREWTTTFVLQDADAWPSAFIIGTSTIGGTGKVYW